MSLLISYWLGYLIIINSLWAITNNKISTASWTRTCKRWPGCVLYWHESYARFTSSQPSRSKYSSQALLCWDTLWKSNSFSRMLERYPRSLSTSTGIGEGLFTRRSWNISRKYLRSKINIELRWWNWKLSWKNSMISLILWKTRWKGWRSWSTNIYHHRTKNRVTKTKAGGKMTPPWSELW